MTNDSFSETAENNSREVCPSTSATVFVKLPSINKNFFDGKPENWHTFIDSFECAIDKNDTLSDIQTKIRRKILRQEINNSFLHE